MTRRTATKPTVKVGGQWLSSIIPERGSWGSLSHSTRLNGDWQIDWAVIAPEGWRHPALTYGALVELYLGPVLVASGTLDEPDWDGMTFTALGASRDGDDAIGLDASGEATTVPNTAIDEAISRGVLPWTRVGDFGSTPVGEEGDAGQLVTITSILNAWADENGSDWRVTPNRELIIEPHPVTVPSWHVLPGSGVLGSAADDRADRIVVRYISDLSGTLANAWYPATTPPSGIEAPSDITDRGKMSAAKAEAIAQSRWEQLNGRSGWTNGLTLINGQVTSPGGIVADLATIRAGQTVRLLSVPDPRGLSQNLDVVIGETDYDWDEDSIQINPVGTAARTEDAVLEQVSELASDAIAASGGRTGFADTGDLAASSPFTGTARAVRSGPTVTIHGELQRSSGSDTAFIPTGIVLPAGFRPTINATGPESTRFNGTVQYRYQVGDNGELRISMTGNEDRVLVCDFAYFVD